MYKNIYGLTCIENHVLALLRINSIEERFLYCDSYVLATNLYDQISCGISVFDYTGIARAQNICKDLRIIRMNKRVGDRIVTAKNNSVILMRVTPDFNKSVLLSRAYRNDHYVVVKKTDVEDVITIINDIPQKYITIDRQILKTAYAGDYFEFEVLRNFTNDDKNFCIERWKKNSLQCFAELNTEEILTKNNNENKFRDFLLLLKILRKRCLLFCEVCGFPIEINSLYSRYEAIFTKYEYHFLRKRVCASLIEDIINEINSLEKHFFERVKECR